MSEPNPSSTPKWLSDLQQRSWEPEILLSGIVLYGMFKVPDILDDFLVYYKLNIFGNSNDIDNLIALFKMGIYWLITGLILHLICRGIWIGMVGLSYTFPKGITQSKLNYKRKFDEKIQRIPSYEQIVIRLEKISSSLFSISFMLFMSLIGGYLYFVVLVIVPFITAYLYFDLQFSGPFFDAFQIYVVVVVGIALLALLDFLSLGYLRRFTWFAKIFWPIHRVVSTLTLSRFYRSIYYGFVTNFNRWIFFSFLLIFIFVSIVGAVSISNTTYPGEQYSRVTLWGDAIGYNVYNGYYDDQNAENFSQRAQIPSDVITGDVLKLFVVARISMEDNMLDYTPLDSLEEVYPDTSKSALRLMVVKEFYDLSINDSSLIVDEWFYHYKIQTKQRGYLTYLNISHLPEGMHKLEISGPKENYNSPFSIIPFYRDLALNPAVSTPEKPAKKSEDFQPKPFGVRD